MKKINIVEFKLYRVKPYLVSRAHKSVFNKESEALFIMVTKRDDRSERGYLAFIKPKKEWKNQTIIIFYEIKPYNS